MENMRARKKKIVITGRVVAGAKKGRRMISLFETCFKEKFHLQPFFGTLNLRLIHVRDLLKIVKLLQESDGTILTPLKNNKIRCNLKCFQASISKGRKSLRLKCFVIFSSFRSYFPDTIEVVSALNLREKLHLKNWDIVNLSI